MTRDYGIWAESTAYDMRDFYEANRPLRWWEKRNLPGSWGCSSDDLMLGLMNIAVQAYKDDSTSKREETIANSLDNLGDRLLANDQREALLNQTVVDAQLMLDVKAWLQECHDWLLANDLDMRCPMEVDPLDLIDQIDFSFGLAVVRSASGMEAPSGGETAQTGSTEGDSPTAATSGGDAQTPGGGGK